MNKILVVGSIGLDTVETPFGQVQDVLGGSATYFSVAASFFTPVNLVAVVGSDFPEKEIGFLQSRKIDTKGLIINPGKTFRWKGKYSYDLNTAQTLDTQLNVFAQFKPVLPADYEDAPFVLLANIDPELQLEVLQQVKDPKFIACDTMNYWIEKKVDALKKVIAKVDLLFINEAEIRQLTQELNLVKASKKIFSWGTKHVIVKQGEYGALMFSQGAVFSAPGFPLEEVNDTTGAGDSFAGGFMGYLAQKGELSEKYFRQSTIIGSVMASFNVEDFSLNRFKRLKYEEIEQRFKEFKRLSHFEETL
ncbi:MAG: PfkB family carbohydrate kinase [bacterium]|nr:PfkB family carbohydrate kinase [bacterium]